MKPLFIPLKTAYFNAFEAGTKDTEFRPYGPRWNEGTCAIGREVVLSHGYGKQRRLSGVVAGFERSAGPTKTQDWRDCYGAKGGDAACVRVALLGKVGAGNAPSVEVSGPYDLTRCQKCGHEAPHHYAGCSDAG